MQRRVKLPMKRFRSQLLSPTGCFVGAVFRVGVQEPERKEDNLWFLVFNWSGRLTQI